tara:strand:- start:9 stop:623 length:615 start_codon:yes stop_codon:yes gene_type:complete
MIVELLNHTNTLATCMITLVTMTAVMTPFAIALMLWVEDALQHVQNMYYREAAPVVHTHTDPNPILVFTVPEHMTSWPTIQEIEAKRVREQDWQDVMDCYAKQCSQEPEPLTEEELSMWDIPSAVVEEAGEVDIVDAIMSAIGVDSEYRPWQVHVGTVNMTTSLQKRTVAKVAKVPYKYVPQMDVPEPGEYMMLNSWGGGAHRF